MRRVGAGVRGLKRALLETGHHEGPEPRFGLGSLRDVGSRTPGQLDRALLGFLPHQQHARRFEHVGALAHQLRSQFIGLPRHAPRPRDEPSELALEAVVVRAEIPDQHRDDRQMDDADQEGVEAEGSEPEHHGRVDTGGGVERDRHHRGPHRAACPPAQRAADHQESEVSEERTGGAVGVVVEERKRGEIEGVLRDVPAAREAHRRPHQAQDKDAVEQVPAERVGQRPRAQRVGRAHRNGEQRAGGKHDATDRDQPLDADAWRILGNEVERWRPHQQPVPGSSGTRAHDARGKPNLGVSVRDGLGPWQLEIVATDRPQIMGIRGKR